MISITSTAASPNSISFCPRLPLPIFRKTAISSPVLLRVHHGLHMKYVNIFNMSITTLINLHIYIYTYIFCCTWIQYQFHESWSLVISSKCLTLNMTWKKKKTITCVVISVERTWSSSDTSEADFFVASYRLLLLVSRVSAKAFSTTGSFLWWRADAEWSDDGIFWTTKGDMQIWELVDPRLLDLSSEWHVQQCVGQKYILY